MKILCLSFTEKKYKLHTVLLALLCTLLILISVILSAHANSYYIPADAPSVQKTIIIDAGHGGEDCGTIGYNGVYEKDLNLQIALKLGEYLKSAGMNVIFTRTDDKLLYTEEQNIKGMRKIYDLKNRVAIADSYENALLISIHMNFYGAATCSGLQVYHGSDKQSQRLASSIQNEVISTLQKSNKRAIKEGKDIYILENSVNPAVLIECGFLSNPEECEKLSQKEYQKELCFAILCGIIKYIDG